MPQLYEIFAYDPFGTAQMVLQGWEYLEFTQRLNAPWNHNLRFTISPKDHAGQEYVSFLRDTIDVDWIIRVRRVDPSNPTQHITVYEGFNRTFVDQAKANGSIIVNIYGSGYTELLSRRVVVPATGYESSDKVGNAETIIKAYVTDQCVSPADSARTIPGLSVEADTSSGKLVAYSAQYTNLLSAISKIAEDGSVDFGVIQGSGGIGTFALRVVPSWGQDKSTNNQYGINPVVFDLGAGNMDIPIFSRNRSDERNFVYVGGQGEGLNRIFRTYNTANVQDSPFNRREAFVDARNQRLLAGIQAAGIAYLSNYEGKETLTFNVIQTPGLRWLQHWSLGDIVTAKYYNRTFDQHITKITVRVGSGAGQGQREYVAPEMETLAHTWLLGVVGRSELDETTILG